MARVLEWSAYQESADEIVMRKGVKMKTNKKVLQWAGFIKVDPSKSDEEIEASVEKANLSFKKAFKARADELGVTMAELPKEDVHELQKGLAEDLRAAYGKRASDAELLTQPKRLDIIRLAEKFSIDPGEPGWAEKVVELVKQDKHIGVENVEE